MTPWPQTALSEALLHAGPGFACGEDLAVGVFQFRMNNITTGGQLDFSKRRRVPRDTRNLDRYLLEPGDVLFNATNSPDLVGKAAYFPGMDEPAVFSNHFLRLRPLADRLDGRFLSRWLNLLFQRGRFKGMCRQWVNQATVSRDSLLSLRVPLPPLPEQRRIAEILDKADALRAKRRAALAQLDTLAQSIFLDMFGDPVANPKGWSIRTFDETVRDETSKAEKLQRSDYLLHGKHPVVDQGQSVIAGYCDDERYLCPSELPVVVFGDHTRAVKLVRHRFVVGADGAKVLVPQSGVDTVFLSYLMRVLPILNLGYSRHMREVKRLAFPIPSIGLQQEFARRIAQVELHCALHERSRGELDYLLVSLQHRAFRGEL